MSTDFSIELRAARKKAGLTQYDVAHLLEIGQSSFSDLERGRQTPTIRQLVKLSLIYGRTFESFYATLLWQTRQRLLERLNTIPREVRNSACTFNRASTLSYLKQRLTEELKEYDAAA